MRYEKKRDIFHSYWIDINFQLLSAHKLLGAKLANQINISQPASRGLIKLSIKDEVGPFKPLEKLSYDDLKLTLQNALRVRLVNLKVANSDQIIALLLDELYKNQSLITIASA